MGVSTWYQSFGHFCFSLVTYFSWFKQVGLCALGSSIQVWQMDFLPLEAFKVLQEGPKPCNTLTLDTWPPDLESTFLLSYTPCGTSLGQPRNLALHSAATLNPPRTQNTATAQGLWALS